MWFVTGVPRLILSCIASLPLLDTPLLSLRTSKTSALLVALTLLSLASFWERQVTRSVPNPYLDEVFHIPQAQDYCFGWFTKWDPKLTTPPGLYVFATIFSKVWPGSTEATQCSNFVLPHVLRFFNCLALTLTFFYACDCRSLIARTWGKHSVWAVSSWPKLNKPLNADSLHTALNVALFPPLFFFSGLFYTDILSTCVVLRTYRLFLERRGSFTNSGEGLVWIYTTGLVSLTMRQTNIFWVAVFLGALELVRTLECNQTQASRKSQGPLCWQGMVKLKLSEYSHGEIHDVPLKDAGIHDFLLCSISIAIAAVFHPIIVVTRLWPYLALLLSFAGFVFWNGGVVLGDKSNHVATIHLPQILYIWPFITFFSLPLMAPVGLAALLNLNRLLSTPLFPRLVRKYILVTGYVAVSLAATLTIIKFNTIIHPFTLADNRHYMFYVFRYTILRHASIRYLLAPVYLGCAYLVYLTLCTISTSPNTLSLKDQKLKGNQTTATDIPKEQGTLSEGPKTSFILILLVTSALSLITAPLVEPRYFIIPWVVWRLNIPSLVSSDPSAKQRSAETLVRGFKEWESHDYRLWFETAWFLLINVVTGYIFLYRGFEWSQEPGNVQRFMW